MIEVGSSERKGSSSVDRKRGSGQTQEGRYLGGGRNDSL